MERKTMTLNGDFALTSPDEIPMIPIHEFLHFYQDDLLQNDRPSPYHGVLENLSPGQMLKADGPYSKGFRMDELFSYAHDLKLIESRGLIAETRTLLGGYKDRVDLHKQMAQVALYSADQALTNLEQYPNYATFSVDEDRAPGKVTARISIAKYGKQVATLRAWLVQVKETDSNEKKLAAFKQYLQELKATAAEHLRDAKTK
jgi:hypothetical protein